MGPVDPDRKRRRERYPSTCSRSILRSAPAPAYYAPGSLFHCAALVLPSRRLKGFTAAVVGGIGNIPGAMLGGFLLGLVEAFATGFISSTYKDVIAFMVLVLVLLIRPRGLLGAAVLKKV